MIVLDASAAVEIANGSPTGDALRSLIEENERLISCDMFRAEVRNSFWKYVIARLMTEEHALKTHFSCHQLDRRLCAHRRAGERGAP